MIKQAIVDNKTDFSKTTLLVRIFFKTYTTLKLKLKDISKMGTLGQTKGDWVKS